MHTTQRPTKKLTRLETLQLALKAEADERSVKKVLAGGTLKGDALDKRVRAVLKAAGLLLALLALTPSCSSMAFADPTTGEPAAVAAKLIDSLYVSGFGSSAASGTVQFFSVGTLNQATVFSDDGLTQIITQPITLDVNGKTPQPVYTATPLRAIVKSSAGTTLADISRIDGDRAELVGLSNSAWTATDINSAFTAIKTSTGGVDGQFQDASSGAVARSIQAKFSEAQRSIKDFGAVGNGIADDTVAIQATINAVASAGGGAVLVPPGTFLISSALTIANSPAAVSISGASRGVSVIKSSNATANAFTVTSVGVVTFRSLTISHSSSSSGSAISVATGGSVVIDTVSISSFANGVSTTASTVYAQNAIIDASTAGLAQSGSSTATLIGGQYTSGTGSGITTTGVGAVLRAFGLNVTGATIAIDVGASASLFAYGVANTAGGAVVGYRAAATSSTIFHQGCDWGGGGVNDGRTGVPVNYTVASTPVTINPLPNQTDAIRIIANAGAGTVNVGAVPTLGFGRKFTMICSNNSGGAITWAFNAQYVLSAVPNPATGNRVNLLLEYNPVDNKVYEIGRAATAN